MTIETFNSSWIVCYDWAECAYDVIAGSEWLKCDREHWLNQRTPTRVMLDIAESETAAIERLKSFSRQRQLEIVEPSGDAPAAFALAH
jgi:hypothetical protein